MLLSALTLSAAESFTSLLLLVLTLAWERDFLNLLDLKPLWIIDHYIKGLSAKLPGFSLSLQLQAKQTPFSKTLLKFARSQNTPTTLIFSTKFPNAAAPVGKRSKN